MTRLTSSRYAKVRPSDIAPLENVRIPGDQEAGAAFGALRWAGAPERARPMSGAERAGKRSRSRLPGKAVAVSLRSSQRACAARSMRGIQGRQDDLQLFLSEAVDDGPATGSDGAIAAAPPRRGRSRDRGRDKTAPRPPRRPAAPPASTARRARSGGPAAARCRARRTAG